MEYSPRTGKPPKSASASLLHQLARRHGVQPVYRDESGNRRVVPDASLQALRIMGIPAHTRSIRNWGIGDFGDLNDLILQAGKDLGAAMVGVNPLHALLPGEISPDSLSSRMFHHPL